MDDNDVVWIPNVIEEPIEILEDAEESHNSEVCVTNTFKATNLETTDASRNSHAVAYTSLIPVGEGLQNFSQRVQFNSSSGVLFMGDSVGVKPGSSGVHAIPKDERPEHLESECATNRTEVLEVSVRENFNENVDSDVSEHLSEETLSADEGMQDEKPFLFDCVTTNITQDVSAVASMPVKLEDIKDEYCNEDDYSGREIAIKRETVDFESYINDVPESSSFNKTEDFLKRNPDVFTNFCGLPTFELFGALLEYITDDIKSIRGVTKYEQLFSVLTKLHKNEDNLYLNKFVFPTVYVSIVELLYKKLAVLCKLDFHLLPEVLMPEFDCTQKVNIFGTVTLRVRSDCTSSNSTESVSYLIAYSALGEVFFVSKAFVGKTDVLKMMAQSGVFKKLDDDEWILLYLEDVLYVTQVGKFTEENIRPGKLSAMYSTTVQCYVISIVKRLSEHFRVLRDPIPQFMLYHNVGGSFADKLIFVCCMILNMLPRCTYK